jgi:ring-1,2-phenylacetyl-CoA epoxidase subunit PaaD
MDPEIPVVSVVDMGIIREVDVSPEGVTVTMTPTFSGCPALDVMRRDIEAAVRSLGVACYGACGTHPAVEYGVDQRRRGARSCAASAWLRRPATPAIPTAVAFFDLAECPRCGSTPPSLRNAFGPTLCRMIWYCDECRDAFEQFKPL